MATKVGIIGTGQVGTTLGRRLLQSGHFQVQYGTRNPSSDKVKDLLQQQPGATADAVAATATWGEVVLLATPAWDPTRAREQIQAVVASLGEGIKGKVVIDVVNGVLPWPSLSLSWEGGPSSSEVVQELLPDTAVYKAFNTVGVEQLGAPDGALINGQKLTMLFVGPEERKEAAANVIEGVGFSPKYVGPIRYARNLDAIAELWIHLSIEPVGETRENWGRDFHFQVIQKP